jgi:excisionase family DNA binding protein
MNTLSSEPVLLTLKQTAERLAVSKRTLERQIALGRFPVPLKVGRTSRVPLDSLSNYLKALEQEAARKFWAHRKAQGLAAQV